MFSNFLDLDKIWWIYFKCTRDLSYGTESWDSIILVNEKKKQLTKYLEILFYKNIFRMFIRFLYKCDTDKRVYSVTLSE